MRKWGAIGLLLLAGCEKVPIVDVGATFTLAETTWFAEEQTLFVFYRVDAQQGLGPNSQLELAYRSDVEALPFTALSALTPVHTHLPVDCGPNALCGSMSIQAVNEPTEVQLRLRYHRDGKLTLDAPVHYTPVGPGPAWSNRSLVVYGVFDEKNARVQWRARHQIPPLRNQEVQDYGLRRSFRVEAPAHGSLDFTLDSNPYLYAATPACPDGFVPLNHAAQETTERATFDLAALPFEASGSAEVCGVSTVTDAKGPFVATAFARKNPDVAPPFPSLHSPIREDTVVGVLLRPCLQTISEVHRAMQQQRLLLPDDAEVCIDDWQTPGFEDRLVSLFQSRIDAERANGKDLVLSIALHHADATGALAGHLEAALLRVLPFERDRSSPRVSGAFVFDSLAHGIKTPALRNLVLWCPANVTGADLDTINSVAARTCPLLPKTPDIVLGPVKFNTLPILPTRDQYLTFIGKYSEAQAGQMQALHFLAPERTPISDNVLLGDFGVATFFNAEQFLAQPTDTFSICAVDSQDLSLVAFRSAAVSQPLPLASLPDFHAQAPQPAYQLGLAWDFPFLLKLEYQAMLGGALTVFSLSVPFGFASQQKDTYGGQVWEQSSFDLSKTLLKCTRFCGHPTFDSGGVYEVAAPFDPTYRSQCYRPGFPVPEDGGFPLDP